MNRGLARTIFRLARAAGLHSWLTGAGGLSWAGGLHGGLAGTVFRLSWASRLNRGLTGAVEFARAIWLGRWLAGAGGLDGWTRYGCDGTRGGNQSRTALVYVVELLAILRGLALVLILGGHGRDAGAAVGCDLGGLGADVDAAVASVVGDTVDGGVVDDDSAVIDVGDARDVDVVD
jgi:hypothetical protein